LDVQPPQTEQQQQEPVTQQLQQQIGCLSLLTQIKQLQVDPALLPEGSSGVFSRLQQLQELILESRSTFNLDVL
jgi:hypothetical protein